RFLRGRLPTEQFSQPNLWRGDHAFAWQSPIIARAFNEEVHAAKKEIAAAAVFPGTPGDPQPAVRQQPQLARGPAADYAAGIVHGSLRQLAHLDSPRLRVRPGNIRRHYRQRLRFYTNY